MMIAGRSACVLANIPGRWVHHPVQGRSWAALDTDASPAWGPTVRSSLWLLAWILGRTRKNKIPMTLWREADQVLLVFDL